MPRIGQGTILSHSVNGTDYTPIAHLTEIGEVGVGEGDDIDTTDHDSVDGFREFMRGLVDPGEVSFTGNWEGSASQLLPVTSILSGPTTTLDYFRVVFPDGLGTWDGRGYWKSFNVNPQLDDTMEFTGAVKLSGKPTFVIS